VPTLSDGAGASSAAIRLGAECPTAAGLCCAVSLGNTFGNTTLRNHPQSVGSSGTERTMHWTDLRYLDWTGCRKFPVASS
jgi:hypothetical protein